jgi:hypothetical protein
MLRSLCGLAVAVAVAVPSLAADDAQDPLWLPGGVSDAVGKIGYLSNPKGGLVAVDLEKGDVLWESKDANRPLAVVGKQLAALAVEKDKQNVLRVVVVDTEAKGKKLRESTAITLPDWAVVGSGLDHTQAGKTFTARAQSAKGDLLLNWVARSRYYGGAAPNPEILKRTNKDASGIAKVTLESGKVEMLPADDKKETKSPYVEVAKLPKEVQEVARREQWQIGTVIGPRAYGKVQKAALGKPGAFGGMQTSLVQAVDLKTGKLLWERVYEEQRILPPPP